MSKRQRNVILDRLLVVYYNILLCFKVSKPSGGYRELKHTAFLYFLATNNLKSFKNRTLKKTFRIRKHKVYRFKGDHLYKIPIGISQEGVLAIPKS